MLAYQPRPADHFAPQASSSRASAPTASSSVQPTRTCSVRRSSYDPPPLARTAPVSFPSSSARLPVAPPAPPAGPQQTAAAQVQGKPDKGKLTEQWGPPPDQVKRDDELLERGRLLGEGGFARVYLATEQNGDVKALKVVAKEQLKSSKNKGKLFAEIKIHQAMKHVNIINFEHCFEDERNVYMQLELCANGSLLDLLRRRRRYSEPEARYYIVQLIGACEYMHDNSVIHRDLKLGNLMVDHDMNLRVGDFGLAALVKFPGERKKTICGTPNYIAPEILFDTTNGHSFEVDIWSIGVILYTLLVGKPPFQMKDVKNIYRKIKDNNYEFPPGVELSPEAIHLIESILTTQPDQRPTLQDILKHDFFTSGPFPASIPSSAMNCAPDFRQISIRRSLANFKLVKEQCGIVEDDQLQQPVKAVVQPSRSQPLAAVAEDEELDVRAPVAAPPIRRPATAQEKEMDREVARAIEPDSPVSELLRSARKPLVVSPQAEPREVIQRQMVNDARTRTNSANGTVPSQRLPFPSRTSSVSIVRPDENIDPRPAAGQTPESPRGKHKRQIVPPAVVAALSPSRHANAGGARSTAEAVAPMAALVSKPSALGPTREPVSARFPARDLYDSTARALDQAFAATSSALIDALPVPEKLSTPQVFITSWVDYTHKYGTSYSLTDGASGVYFNDSTTMVLAPDKNHFDFIAREDGRTVFTRKHFSMKSHPAELERKAHLLRFFDDYMNKTLTRSVEGLADEEKKRTRNMDFLVKYYRMKNAIVFKMSNEVLQFNFYDHTKILITNRGTAVTFLDTSFSPTTYSVASLFREAARLGYYAKLGAEEGDSKRRAKLEQVKFMLSKLDYARDVLRTLAARRTASGRSEEGNEHTAV